MTVETTEVHSIHWYDQEILFRLFAVIRGWVSNNIQLSIEMMLGAKEAQSVLGNDPPHHHTPTTSFTCWYQAGWSCAFIYVYTKF